MIGLLFDNETTGLTRHPQAGIGRQPRIIEFAGILVEDGEIIDTMEFVCNPGIAIEAIITKITGLTNADLEDKPKFPAFVDQLAEFCGRADFSIAHNHTFDRNMLIYDLSRIDKDLSHINFPTLNVCTVEETQPKYGRPMKLSELYELNVGPYVQKHRALDDVRLLHEICIHEGIYNYLLRGVQK